MMADDHVSMLLTLATGSSARALVLAGVLVALAIVGGAVAMLIRRRALSADSSIAEGVLPLSTIREMHRRGELSDEEFTSLRAASLAAFGVQDKAGGPGKAQGEARVAPPGVDLAGDPLPDRSPDNPESGGEKNGPEGV